MIPYYRHFGLERDPFLDTADPHFYRTTPALARARDRLVGGVLESRGLQVIVGDPGTGKTSLMAQTERELLGRDDVRLGKILDPSFATETEFLLGVARSFGLALPPRSPAALKNALKNYLYDAAVLDGLTIALLDDDLLDAIVGAAAGTPRRLLTLAHATLREAAAYGRPRATRTDAEAAARLRGLSVPKPVPSSNGVAQAAPPPVDAAAPADSARRWWQFPWLAAFRMR